MSCEDDEKTLTQVAKAPEGFRLLEYPAQNPAPPDIGGQSFADQVRLTADRIMRVFLSTLPSNYVSQVNGPWYSLQFQGMIEQLARYQVEAIEAYENTDFDFTRPEYLWQTLGILVFPRVEQGIPDIDGDLTYRDFLKAMVRLLLSGATKDAVREGAGLTTEGIISIIEKFQFPESAWGLDEQFGFELFVESYLRTDVSEDGSHYHEVQVDCEGKGTTTTTVCLDGFTCQDHEHEIEGLLLEETSALPEHPLHDHRLIPAFPVDAFTLQENIIKILRALKPAHTIYELRFLFREFFGRPTLDENGNVTFEGSFFDDTVTWSMFSYYYDDLRKYCLGAKEIRSEFGETLTDLRLFSDPTRSFQPLEPNSTLVIEGGLNQGTYKVLSILTFPVGDDSTPRAYLTAPSGLSGTCTVSGDAIEDPTQDFGSVQEGETITITEGPNQGTYLLEALLGQFGGPVGSSVGPASKVRVSPSILSVDRRMNSALTGQSYRVTVDRLGAAVPQEVIGEDASRFFYL